MFTALPKRLASTLAASLLLGAAFAAHAEAADSPSYRRAPATMPSPSCDSVRLSSWFERQRQLTDGAADPYARIETPQQCDDSKRAQAARDQSRPVTETREAART